MRTGGRRIEEEEKRKRRGRGARGTKTREEKKGSGRRKKKCRRGKRGRRKRRRGISVGSCVQRRCVALCVADVHGMITGGSDWELSAYRFVLGLSPDSFQSS